MLWFMTRFLKFPRNLKFSLKLKKNVSQSAGSPEIPLGHNYYANPQIFSETAKIILSSVGKYTKFSKKYYVV